MSGERNVSGSGTAQKVRTPPHDARVRDISVLHDGSFRAVSQSELAQFFKREQGSARALRLQRAATLKASLSEAAADRRALRRLEEQLREFDRSANHRHRMRALPGERKAQKPRGSPKIAITRLSRPLPSYPAPIIDRLGRRGVFFQIEYDSPRDNAFGVAARRIGYMFDESHADLVDGKVAFFSSMGQTREEIEAAADVSETASRAARKNAKLGFSAIYQLSPEFDQAERVKALKRLAASFDRRGAPYCMVLHAPSPEGDQRNFHIHVWFSHRPMERIAPYEWAVAEQLRSDLAGPDAMRNLRREWAEILTEVSLAKPSRTVFTALSNAARGLPNMPLRKLSRHQVERYRRGGIVVDVEANGAIIAENCRLADKLRRERSGPVTSRAGIDVVPQERPVAPKATAVDPPVGRSPRVIVAPSSKIVAAKPTEPVPVRPQRNQQKRDLTIPRRPECRRVAPAAPERRPDLQPVGPPRGVLARPELQTSSRPVTPAALKPAIAAITAPHRTRKISVTAAPLSRTVKPVTPTQPRMITPQSLHFLSPGHWKPVSPRGYRPKPVKKTAPPPSLQIDPALLSQGRTVQPVDRLIEAYGDWDNGGAERWLVDQGMQAAQAAGLVSKAREIGAVPISEPTAPYTGLPVISKTEMAERPRSPGAFYRAPARAATHANQERSARKSSMLDRLEQLGRSLQAQTDGHDDVSPPLVQPVTDPSLAKLTPSLASGLADRLRGLVMRMSELEAAFPPKRGPAGLREDVERFLRSSHLFAAAGEHFAYGGPLIFGDLRLHEHLERKRLGVLVEDTDKALDIASDLVKLYLFHIDRDEDGFELRKRAQRRKTALRQVAAQETASLEKANQPTQRQVYEISTSPVPSRLTTNKRRQEAPAMAGARHKGQAEGRTASATTTAAAVDQSAFSPRTRYKSNRSVLYADPSTNPDLRARWEVNRQPSSSPPQSPAFDLEAERQRVQVLRSRGEQSEGLAVVKGLHPKIDRWLMTHADTQARQLAAQAIVADREALSVLGRLCSEDQMRIRQDTRMHRTADPRGSGRTPQSSRSGHALGQDGGHSP